MNKPGNNVVPIQPVAEEENPNRLPFSLEEMLAEFDNGQVPRSTYWKGMIRALYETANHVVTGVVSVADIKPDEMGDIPLSPYDINIQDINRDVIGRQLFFGDACKVQHQQGAHYRVLPGPGYVGGVKFFYPGKEDIELPDTGKSFWLDVCWSNPSSTRGQSIEQVVVADQLADYEDEIGVQHYVEKLADFRPDGTVIDRRNRDALNKVFNRDVVDFGPGVAFGPYEEDGRTLLPRLTIGAVEYVAVSDVTENLTFTSADVDDRFDGTVVVQTSDGEKIFSKIGSEAVCQQTLEKTLSDINYNLKPIVSEGSTEPRALSERFADVINVNDFGTVGDGVTDDTDAIQKAIDSAVPYSEIHFSRGKYLCGGLNVISNSLLITGAGLLIKKADTTYGIGISGKGCIVSNLSFTSEKTSDQPNTNIKFLEGCEDVRVESCTFEGNCYSAITAADDPDVGGAHYTSPVKGILIKGNIFKSLDKPNKECHARPLLMVSIQNLTITDNIFRDTSHDAIRIREDNGFINITDNQFFDIGDPSWGEDRTTRDAIDTAFDANFMIIANNVINGTAYCGIDIKAPSGTAIGLRNKKIIIQGNIISNTRFEGITIANQNPETNDVYLDCIIVDSNQIVAANLNKESVGDSGIKVSYNIRNVSITNNNVSSCFGRGIYMVGATASAYQSRYTRISGNQVTNCSDAGIHLSDVGICIVSENICVNDGRRDNPNAQKIGIVSYQTDTTTIKSSSHLINNICVDNTDNQITIGGTGDSSNLWNSISGNVELGAGAYASHARIKNSKRMLSGSAAPLASDGEFEVGDMVLNSEPSVGEYMGWVCVGSGNPGSWAVLSMIV